MRVGLYIVVEVEGEPFTLARVWDVPLLVHAACLAAVKEANSKAVVMALENELLGALQQQEASRLRSALELAIPEFKFTEENPIRVQ